MKRLYTLALIFLSGLLLLSTHTTLYAQQEQVKTDPITTSPYRLLYLSHDLSFGWCTSHNEYLSPLPYQGYTLSYRFSSEAPLTQSHPEWLVRQNSQVTCGLLLNPARNGVTNLIALETQWGFVHQWRLPFGMTIGVGPGVMVEGITSYNGRNQNNPADQQLNGDLTAQALAAYRIRLGWFVADLRLQMTSALFGLGFAPYYNESYLQVYSYDKIINHIAPHTFGRRHFYQVGLAIDLPIWRIMTIRLSYDYTNSARRIHAIYRGHSEHTLGIGFATYFRPFRGYQEVQNKDHTTAINL